MVELKSKAEGTRGAFRREVVRRRVSEVFLGGREASHGCLSDSQDETEQGVRHTLTPDLARVRLVRPVSSAHVLHRRKDLACSTATP